MSGPLTAIRRTYLRHEIWALKCAMKWPFFAIHITGTLFVWPFVFIGIPGTLMSVYSFTTGNMTFFYLFSAIAAIAILPMSIYSFEWYLISAGLMFGSRTRALAKLDELKKRLYALS